MAIQSLNRCVAPPSGAGACLRHQNFRPDVLPRTHHRSAVAIVTPSRNQAGDRALSRRQVRVAGRLVMAHAEILALRVLAERLEHQENGPHAINISIPA